MDYDNFTTFKVETGEAIAWVTFDYPPVNVQGLPMLADLKPSGQYVMEELHEVGGDARDGEGAGDRAGDGAVDVEEEAEGRGGRGHGSHPPAGVRYADATGDTDGLPYVPGVRRRRARQPRDPGRRGPRIR